MSTQSIASPCCQLVHANGVGTTTGYFPSANTDAACGVQIVAAIGDAASGDTIVVWRSASVAQSLAKAGVNWWFGPGVIITWDDNTSGFMFDDGGSAMTFSIGGDGTFRRYVQNTGSGQTNVHGIFKLNNASTSIYCEFDTLNLYLKTNTGNKDCQASVVDQIAGNIDLRGKKIIVENDEASNLSVAYGLWWENGDCNVIVSEITAGTRNSALYGVGLIYPSVSLTPTGELRVICNTLDARISDSNGAAFSSVSSQATARAWVQANTIYGYVQGIGVGGLNYVTTQKLTGCVAWSTGGTLYIDAMKIGGNLAAANGISQNFINVAGGTVRARVGHFDTGTNATELVSVSSGTCYLDCQEAVGLTSQDAILVSGGTLNLQSGIITKATGKLSLKRTAGTLNVTPSVQYLLADTSGTITTLNLYGVVPGTTFKSTTIGT